MISRSKLALAVGLLALASGAAYAATRLQAPVKMLMKGHNRVAVVSAVDKTGDLKITFENRRTFYGEAEERVTLRVDEATYADVEVGATYVAAFSNVRRNHRFRELREIDPEGFRLLSILGGGPALLEDSAAVRLLFGPAAGEGAASPRARLEAALAAARSDDSRTRAFAVLELHLRPEWHELMGAEDVAGLRDLLRDPRLGPDLRHYLLETADDLQAAWLAEESRRILLGIEPQLDLTSFFPQLASTTIRILETRGEKADGPLVSRFLAANNPGVVKAAIQTLDRLDPALARSRAEAALDRQGLHAESRRALAEYLG